MIMSRRLSALLAIAFSIALTMVLAGCNTTGSLSSVTVEPREGSGSAETQAATPTPTPQTQVTFDPTTGTLNTIFFPVDFLRNSTTGFNNLPGSGEPIASFNSIKGFSTAGHIYITFTGTVNATSITPQSVLVLNTATKSNVQVTMNVTPGPSGTNTLDLKPVLPLSSGTTYLVIVTDGVTGNGNLAVISSPILTLMKQTSPLVVGGSSTVVGLSLAQAQQLEQLRLYFQPVWAAAEAALNTNRSNIPAAFTFTTQPQAVNGGEFSTLQQLFQTTNAQNPTPTVSSLNVPPFGTVPLVFANGTPLTVQDFYTLIVGQGTNPNIPNSSIGSVVIGTFPATNYVSDPLNGPFQVDANGNVVAQGTTQQGFVAFMPNTAANGPPVAGPVPVVIFQHGFTRTMLDTAAIANTLCSQGFGVVGINLVLHGPPTSSGLPTNTLSGQTSGTDFINLANLRQSRDNVRMSVVNLFTLARTIKRGAFNGTGGLPNFSATNLTFSGQSLGGIVGGVYVSLEQFSNTLVPPAVLNVPGGRISDLLINSPEISVQVNAGLAAQGILPGTPAYTQFFFLGQTVFDDGDPFNYGPHLLAGDLANNTKHQILMQYMLGDQVVPNSAAVDLALAINNGSSAALPNVNNLLPIAGLPNVSIATSTFPVPGAFQAGSSLFQYQDGIPDGTLPTQTGGGHGFLLNPAVVVNATTTSISQAQVVNYLATGLASAGGAQTVDFGHGGPPGRTATPSPGGVNTQTMDFSTIVLPPGGLSH